MDGAGLEQAAGLEQGTGLAFQFSLILQSTNVGMLGTPEQSAAVLCKRL